MVESSTLQRRPPQRSLPVEWVERVFTVLSAIYLRKFADQFAGVDPAAVKEQWAAGLAGFTGEEINAGIEACRANRFVPDLPEFRARCRPSLDYEAAYIEACEQMRYRRSTIKAEQQRERWSHPAIFWAAAEMGDDLTGYAYQLARVRWKIALDAAHARIRAGELPEKVPPRAEALPAPDNVLRGSERAEKIARLKSELFGVPSTTPTQEMTEEQRQARIQKIDQALETVNRKGA